MLCPGTLKMAPCCHRQMLENMEERLGSREAELEAANKRIVEYEAQIRECTSVAALLSSTALFLVR